MNPLYHEWWGGFIDGMRSEYPSLTTVNIVGIPSKLNYYKKNFGGYMFEIYDREFIAYNAFAFKIVCIVFGAFFALGEFSMLIRVINEF